MPVGRIHYTYKDFNGTIQIGENIYVEFNRVDETIKRMKDIKKKYGEYFMFFNQSIEGEQWFKDNPIKISFPY